MAKRKAKKEWEPKSKEEGNKFDKIFQENMRELAPFLLEALLGRKDYRLEPLPQVRMQVTREKGPDFLQSIFDEHSPLGRLLHVEFEGQDIPGVDWSMADYCGMAGVIFRKEIEQHLIYFGVGTPNNIYGEIKHTNYTYKYCLHLLSQFDAQKFLQYDKPEVVIFAILADPAGYSAEDILNMIFQRLLALKGDYKAIRKFVRQLWMLSAKRNLQAKTIEVMKKFEDVQEHEFDPYFIWGEEIGIEKGIEKGIESGQAMKDIIAIRNMLAKSFELQTIADILEVTQDYVLDIKNQLAKEPEIVANLKKKMPVSSIANALKVSPLVVEVLKKEHGF